jgi:hypothetical protein
VKFTETDIQEGIPLRVIENGMKMFSLLIREGCSGSPNCALEIYIAAGYDYLAGLNLHLSDPEAEMLYQALKAVRKARKKALKNG